ncbi:MAG: M23 family metallopeptidase [Bacteroidales bacterium]|jgi:murein DD-endopeptidase MepM/ murein hydrolase activator NlpD|nr:M23 family metallopeptidase [Bacteroidales bacterium]
MAKSRKKYVMNPETLMVDVQEETRIQGWQILLVSVAGLMLFLLFMWVRVSVMHGDLPKTAILRHTNAEWSTRIDQMSQQLDRYEELLSMMEERDDRVYRSVYGLDEIPQAIRRSGFSGETRYAYLQGTAVADIVKRLDNMEKRVYVQSKSFDDVSTLQRSAGDLASHIPALSPLDPTTYRLSSPFGYRVHPVLGYRKRHTGMDFACPPGNPIYVSGGGVVVKVAHDRGGYGNHVEVDHGFGYKTRYAHMSRIDVKLGQRLERGDCLGLTGRSGLVSGPHLHYEVMYRKEYVNPALYMDLSIPAEDYKDMVRKPEN